MENILDYLDNQLETYYKQNSKYPKKILLIHATYDKIFLELYKMINFDDSWTEQKDNYRGIPLEIDKKTKLFKLI